MKVLNFVVFTIVFLFNFAHAGWRIPKDPPPGKNDILNFSPIPFENLQKRINKCFHKVFFADFVESRKDPNRRDCEYCYLSSEGWEVNEDSQTMTKLVVLQKDRYEGRGTNDEWGRKRYYWMDLAEWEITYDFKTGVYDIDYDSIFKWHSAHPTEDGHYRLENIPAIGFREIEDQSFFLRKSARFVDPYLFSKPDWRISLVKEVGTHAPVLSHDKKAITFDNHEYLKCMLSWEKEQLEDDFFEEVKSFEIDADSIRPSIFDEEYRGLCN